jgi:8-oxo-dGTP diphosphatase
VNSEAPKRLGVAADVVVLTVIDGRLEILLIRRAIEPYEGRWALPGGFVQLDESADDAAARALRQKAGVEGVFLEQLYTFTAPNRDPRNRVISIAYYALVSPEKLPARSGVQDPRWFEVGIDDRGRLRLEPSLAFDHREIIETALSRIRGKLDYAPIGFQLLPERFTLSEIQAVHEAILGRTVDKRNFRTKLLKGGLVREVDELRTGPHRPARLYEFTSSA